MVHSILQASGFETPKKIFKEYSYLAFVKEKPVAILLASPAKECPRKNLTGQALQIDQIAVLPEQRKKGLGSYLVNHFMTQWALFMDIHLDCFEDWLEEFYQNFGFSVVDRRAEIHEQPELRTSMTCKAWTTQSPELKEHIQTIFEHHKNGTLVQ